MWGTEPPVNNTGHFSHSRNWQGVGSLCQPQGTGFINIDMVPQALVWCFWLFTKVQPYPGRSPLPQGPSSLGPQVLYTGLWCESRKAPLPVGLTSSHSLVRKCRLPCSPTQPPWPATSGAAGELCPSLCTPQTHWPDHT